MPKKRPTREAEWHRKWAVDLFNRVWTLLLKKRRTRAEIDEMIHAAHASRYHWSKVGTPKNASIGEWQISRVYAVLGRPEPSLYHAQRCLEICEEYRVGDFPLAYAYEALARAFAIAGKSKARAACLRLAKAAGERIREDEDRALFFKDIRTVPQAKRS